MALPDEYKQRIEEEERYETNMARLPWHRRDIYWLSHHNDGLYPDHL